MGTVAPRGLALTIMTAVMVLGGFVPILALQELEKGLPENAIQTDFVHHLGGMRHHHEQPGDHISIEGLTQDIQPRPGYPKGYRTVKRSKEIIFQHVQQRPGYPKGYRQMMSDQPQPEHNELNTLYPKMVGNGDKQYREGPMQPEAPDQEYNTRSIRGHAPHQELKFSQRIPKINYVPNLLENEYRGKENLNHLQPYKTQQGYSNPEYITQIQKGSHFPTLSRETYPSPPMGQMPKQNGIKTQEVAPIGENLFQNIENKIRLKKIEEEADKLEEKAIETEKRAEETKAKADKLEEKAEKQHEMAKQLKNQVEKQHEIAEKEREKADEFDKKAKASLFSGALPITLNFSSKFDNVTALDGLQSDNELSLYRNIWKVLKKKRKKLRKKMRKRRA